MLGEQITLQSMSLMLLIYYSLISPLKTFWLTALKRDVTVESLDLHLLLGRATNSSARWWVWFFLMVLSLFQSETSTLSHNLADIISTNHP